MGDPITVTKIRLLDTYGDGWDNNDQIVNNNNAIVFVPKVPDDSTDDVIITLLLEVNDDRASQFGVYNFEKGYITANFNVSGVFQTAEYDIKLSNKGIYANESYFELYNGDELVFSSDTLDTFNINDTIIENISITVNDLNITFDEPQWNLDSIKFYEYISVESQRTSLLNLMSNSNIKIAIVDEGIQYPDAGNSNATDIPDFSNIDTDLGRGFDGSSTNTTWWPLQLSDNHGTGCATMAVASGSTLYGTAPGIPFVSLRSDLSAASITNALSYENNQIDVYSCSFGYTAAIGTVNIDAFDTAFNWAGSIKEGVLTGRNGKGCIYVFSAGNDYIVYDNGNPVGFDSTSFDFISNLVETIAVGATNYANRSSFSEVGSNLLCTAPGSLVRLFDTNGTIYRNNGTSFSCPQISGICGLILTLREELTWRDVKEIISLSCQQNDPNDGDEGGDLFGWFTNKAGRNYNLQYGFGLIDYVAVINNTNNHTLLPDECGFRINMNTDDSSDIDFTLNEPYSINFTVNSDNEFTQINENVSVPTSLDNFIIQEFSIVFETLYDDTDTPDNVINNVDDQVHELDIKLTINNRGYENDYANQSVIVGRNVSFSAIQLFQYPVLVEFLKGENIVNSDTNDESTWTLTLSDADTSDPLKGRVSHVEFRGYQQNLEGIGFGDPHIIPVTGNKIYNLPHNNVSYLLFDNNSDDRLRVKALLNKPKEFNFIKTKRHNTTYFKYIKFEFNNNEFIVDMDTLKLKEFTNADDLMNFKLPTLENQEVRINNLNMTKSNNIPFKINARKEITSKTSISMTLEFNTSNGNITFHLIADPFGMPILRSNIRMKLKKLNSKYEGSLYKKQIKEVEF